MKKRIWNKFLRFIGVNKPIRLSKGEIMWIKLCKGHYKNSLDKGGWIESLKPTFLEVYGWSADEFYNDYLDCMVNKLLDIHLKIQKDMSGNNVQIKSILKASFYQSVFRQEEEPIERVIAELCSQIQNNVVIEDGIHRYHL